MQKIGVLGANQAALPLTAAVSSNKCHRGNSLSAVAYRLLSSRKSGHRPVWAADIGEAVRRFGVRAKMKRGNLTWQSSNVRSLAA